MKKVSRTRAVCDRKPARYLKPVCCLMLCASLLLTACGGDGISDKDGASGKDGASDQEVISGEGSVSYFNPGREWVYVPEVFTVDTKQYVDYGRMQPVGDTLCYVLQEDTGSREKNICRYSLTGGELETTPINWPEGGNDWDPGYRFFTRDQGLYMTANVYPASGGMKRFLCRFDAEGNCLFSRDITEQAGGNVSIHGLYADSRGRLYIFLDSEEILLYTGEGEYHGSVSYPSSKDQASVQIKGACEGADGRFYACFSQESAGNVRCTLTEIDFENARLAEAAGNLPNIEGLCGGMRRDDHTGQNADSGRRGNDSGETGSNSGGSGEKSAGQASDSPGGGGDPSAEEGDGLGSQYDLLLYDDRAVYGYRFDGLKGDSGSPGEELFLWMDSDINGYCVANLYLLEDGRLCATVEDWLNDDRVIVVLERTKAEEAPRREELVLVTVEEGSDLAAIAVKFNRGNGRYHLTVKSYGSLTDLYNALLAKEPMDLIDLSGVDVRKMAARGLFEDLTPYVEQSEAFGRSDFVDGILDVYNCDTVLAGIPAEFMIRTVVGNRAKLENKAGLALEELYSIADRYPGVRAFDGVTREEMMEYCLMFNEDTFIDRDSGACFFDSEEFKALLAYVSRFPDSAETGREEESLSDRIKRGEVLFAIGETTPYLLWDYVKMFGEDAAYVGFPTADGRGGHLLLGSNAYAIAAVSKHKDSAWDFIEDSLTQKKSELYGELWLTYPALKKTLEERVEAAIVRDRFTWEDINAALQLVPDATPFYSIQEDEIIKIINEEAPAYYTGQKGMDDVVRVIQNRIQLYVNESR